VYDIKREILTSGPVMAGLTVYDDLYTYPKNGNIYVKASTNLQGGHAVRLVGWGESVDAAGNRTPYWSTFR
jgi:C1A family cysteine protease